MTLYDKITSSGIMECVEDFCAMNENFNHIYEVFKNVEFKDFIDAICGWLKLCEAEERYINNIIRLSKFEDLTEILESLSNLYSFYKDKVAFTSYEELIIKLDLNGIKYDY